MSSSFNMLHENHDEMTRHLSAVPQNHDVHAASATKLFSPQHIDPSERIHLEAEIISYNNDQYDLLCNDGRLFKLSELPSTIAAALSTLQTSATLSGVYSQLPTNEHPQFTTLLAQLDELNLLRRLQPAKALRIGLIGEGKLADELRGEIKTLGTLCTFQECLPSTALGRQSSSKRLDRHEKPIRHWTEAADANLDLVLIATSRRAIDPAFSWLLTRARVPYLAVQAYEDQAAVETIVLPGITACLHCHQENTLPTHLSTWLASKLALPKANALAWARQTASAAMRAYFTHEQLWPTMTLSGRIVPITSARTGCPACSLLSHHQYHQQPVAAFKQLNPRDFQNQRQQLDQIPPLIPKLVAHTA